MINWNEKLIAFLHDPPDKALKILNHEERAENLLSNIELSWKKIKADVISSSLQRIVFDSNGKEPSSDFYAKSSGTYVHVGYPVLRHPITGCKKEYGNLIRFCDYLRRTYGYSKLDEFINDVLNAEIDCLKELGGSVGKKGYFRIWNYYKETLRKRLAEMLKQKWSGFIKATFGENESIYNSLAEEAVNLPADTRCPDHTIWDHLDASSAIYGAISGAKPALLMFKISPVQDFIKNARKEKDLWAGSHLLSFLTFQAIKVVVDEFGPDAIVFPHLRGQPFFDKEFEIYFDKIPEKAKNGNKSKEKLYIANIPNKFLAIVGADKVGSIRNKIKGVIDKTLEELLDFSLNESSLSSKINTYMKNYYLKLLQNYFNITVCAISADLNSLIKVIDKLPDKIKEKYENWLSLLEESGYERQIFDLYSLMFELIEETVAIESRKFVKLEGLGKEKCTLCGELEIIGNKDTWKGLNRATFKENERLCPVCLVKRIYPKWIGDKWKIKVGFESVSEVALRKKLDEDLRKKLEDENVTFYDVINDNNLARKLGCYKSLKSFFENVSTILDHLQSGDATLLMGLFKSYTMWSLDHLQLPTNYELIYKENLTNIGAISKTLGINEERIEGILNVDKYLENARNAVKDIERLIGEFPKYYAILMMDGDDMGKMLIGEEMKPVKNYLHPGVLEYIPPKAKMKVENTRRLITPATHSAISRALAHFSIDIVPDIVENYRGELIYAGGDDVLALLPVDSALACAYEIQKKFGGEWDGWNVLPAKTMSAGILIVHYKHPLYDALDKARELEKKAKELGRNAVAIGYLARSGSYDEVVFNWSLVCEIGEIVELIKNSKRDVKPNLSRRIIYHVVQEIESLPSDENALREYLKFEFSRHYSGEGEKVKVLAERVLNMAKNVRVTLTKDDFEELELDIKRTQLVRANSKVNGLIKNEKLSVGKIYEELKDVLNVDRCEFYKKLYGLILKKQIKSSFILLKILVNCDAELRCQP